MTRRPKTLASRTLGSLLASGLAVASSMAPALAIVAAGGLLIGCKKPKPAPPPPPPPPPRVVAPPRPDPVNISGVLTAVGADQRVQFPQQRAPEDEALAKAVAQFAGALAKGSSREFGTYLADESRSILDDLVADGRWEEGVAGIEAVRVVHMTTQMVEREGAMVVSGAQFVLAIQEPGEAYTLGWQARPRGEDGWQFAAIETGGDTKSRASEWDSDSITAFRGSGGQGGQGRGGRAGGGMDMAAIADPLTFYCVSEISMRIVEAMGISGGTRDMMMAQMEAADREKFNTGKAQYDTGAKPTPAQAETVYQLVGMTAGMMRMASAMGQGTTLTDDQIAAIVAEVLGQDVATVKAKLSAAATNAPNLQDFLPPGMELPSELPPGTSPGSRPGTIRRNTPGGPVEIPTRTPGGEDPGGG